MKHRFKSMLSLLLCICFFVCSTLHAEETSLKQVDGSYLTNQESSEGKTENGVARGEHLMDGTCTISKAGIGKIYVYAQTTANHTVDKVAVVATVEQYNEKTDNWDVIDTLIKDAKDTYYVSTAKRITVKRGAYYRVQSDHFVSKGDAYEETFCFTDGIMID